MEHLLSLNKTQMLSFWSLLENMDKTSPHIPESMKFQILYLVLKGEEMRDMGKIDDAMKYYNNAREINEQVRDRFIEALILLQLSVCYISSYRYENAIKTADNSIAISSQLQGKIGKTVQLLVGYGYLNLGHAYYKLGKCDKALKCQEKGIEWLLKYGFKNALGLAYGNMGATYNELGKAENVLELYQEALKIGRTTGDKNMEAGNLYNIGKFYSGLEELQKAVDHFEESARIFTEIGKKKDVCSAHAALASLYSFLGKEDISKAYWNSCTETFIDVTGGNMSEKVIVELWDVLVVATRRALHGSVSKFVLGSDDAKQSLELCVRVLKNTLESTDKLLLHLTDDSNRTALSDQFYRWHNYLTLPLLLLKRDTAALLILDLGRAKILRHLVAPEQVKIQEEEKNKSSFELSWMTIENGKEKERISTLAIDIQLLDKATVLFYNFVEKEKERVLVIWVMGNNGCVSCIDGKTSHRKLEDEMRKLLEMASVEFPRGYSFLERSKVSSDVEELAKELTSVKLLSEEKEERATNHEQQKTKIQESKAEYRSPDKKADATCNDLSKEGLRFLYKALIDPVKSLIKGTKLIIVPARCLFFAPFSSFVDEDGSNLSENYEIQIIPSIHVLASSMLASRSKMIGGSLFVGNPEVVQLEPLFSAEKEIKYLASLLDAKPLTGGMATKSNVMNLMPAASIIHIAAHGDEISGHIFLAPESGEQTKGAHASDAISSSDLLTQSDVLKCKLSARLVVLSCCDSGKGKLSSEGVLGIARSFLGAGASSVLITLWKINDDFTQEFMKVFYQKTFEEKSVCLALKETMNAFQRNGEYTSFMFWAAFEILGEDVRFSKSEIEEIRRKNKEMTVTYS